MQKIVEILEDKLDEKCHPLTIEKTCDKILAKFDRITEQLETKTSGEYEKALYVK